MLNFLSFLGLLVSLGGLAGAYTRFISPNLGIYLILGGIAWMALLAIPAALKTMKWGRRELPAFALYFGLLAAAVGGGIIFQGFTHPLNDLSTNTAKAPGFLRPVYLFQPKNGAEFLDKSLEINREYRAENAGYQNTHYPELETINIKAPLADVQPVIERVVREQFPDWRVVANEKSFPHIEIEAENPILRAIDDIVIEARTAKNNPSSTNVDIRFRTRFPYGDLGYNAARSIKLRQALIPALDQAANKYADFTKNYAKNVIPLGAPPASVSLEAAAPSASEPKPSEAPASGPKPSAAKSRLTGKLPGLEE